MEVDKQLQLRETLYCRVGELTSHLGFFELNLFTYISHLKRDQVLIGYAKKWQFDARIELVRKLLTERKAPEEIRRARAARSIN
jgi:hypothetical protein